MHPRPVLRRANNEREQNYKSIKRQSDLACTCNTGNCIYDRKREIYQSNNILTLLRQVSMYGIASIGMTFVILLGDIDLSTGTVISFVNILCAHMMVNMGMNPVIAVLISLVASTLIGVLNGFMVATVGIPAIIATYATQTAFMGIALIMCGGMPISGFSKGFAMIGQGYVGVVPIQLLLWRSVLR